MFLYNRYNDINPPTFNQIWDEKSVYYTQDFTPVLIFTQFQSTNLCSLSSCRIILIQNLKKYFLEMLLLIIYWIELFIFCRDPYRYSDDEYDDDDDDDVLKPTKVDIDISMSAYGNSRKYVYHILHSINFFDIL